MNTIRPRSLVSVFGTLVIFTLLVAFDPESQLISAPPYLAGSIAWIILSLRAVVGVALLFAVRKMFLDYPEADFRVLGARARENPIGAGLYAIAVSMQTVIIGAIIAIAMFKG